MTTPELEADALAVAVADLAASVAALEHCAATEAAALEALAADVAAIRAVTDTLAVLLREMAPALDAMAAGGGPFAVLGAMRR